MDGRSAAANDGGNGGSDMIIAFGGLITAHAVVKRSKKPFIVMIGHLPDSSDFALSDNENYYGGIDLHTAPRRIMITLTQSALFIKQTGIVELGEPIGRPAGEASVN